MKENVVKVITLIVLIVLVIITFNLTNKKENETENPVPVNSSTIEKKENENTPSTGKETKVEEKEEEKKEDEKTTVEPEKEETNLIKQYKVYNKYIVTSDNTQYKDVDYKYFIIGSYSQFKQYIDSYSNILNTTNEYDSYNKNSEDKINSEINEDFFKDNRLIIIVDMNKKNQINGNINEVAIDEEGQLNVKIKKETTGNTANSIIYMLPVQKSVKSVKVSHVN